MKATGDPDLELALRWSEAVNRSISEIVVEVPPFPLVRESLESMQRQGRRDGGLGDPARGPRAGMVRAWADRARVALLAGQELGSKKEHLALAAGGRYEPEKILMVGDALGDWEAARASGALFYPIDPGYEDESWQRFFEEALPRFFAGNYAGEYMDAQLDAIREAFARTTAVETRTDDEIAALDSTDWPIE